MLHCLIHNVPDIQDAAKKLKADAIQYEHSPIVETVKRIANMYLEMAHLIRSDFPIICLTLRLIFVVLL